MVVRHIIRDAADSESVDEHNLRVRPGFVDWLGQERKLCQRFPKLDSARCVTKIGGYLGNGVEPTRPEKNHHTGEHHHSMAQEIAVVIEKSRRILFGTIAKVCRGPAT